MKYMRKFWNWDYDLPDNWVPKTEAQWLWYLERKINYDDWQGLKEEQIQKHFPKLKARLDPGKRKMLELYFADYARINYPPAAKNS